MGDSESLLRENIKDLLQQRRKLPADLARHLGKTNPWVSQLLSGRNSVPIKLLSEIADFFEVQVEELFSGKPLTGRPVFSHDTGAVFQRLREDAPNNTPLPAQKRYRPNMKPRTKLGTQMRASKEAKRLGIPGLTMNMLWRAENGKIKRPSAEFLRAIAQLYGYEYEFVVNEIAKVSFGLTAPVTATTDDRNNASGSTGVAVESVRQHKRSSHVSPSPSISASSERTRALEAGLRNILAIATTLLGEAARARFADTVGLTRGTERTSTEAARSSPRDRRPHAKSAGARR